MKFNRNQAKALTNAKELELYDNARAPRLNKLTVKELKNLVKRSRTLRDKLRDVKRSQVRSGQSKVRSRGTAPVDRSKEKAELFSEVHDIFVARLEKVEAHEVKAKAVSSDKKPSKKDKNIKTRADRTGVRQKLKAVKKQAKRTTETKADIVIPTSGTKRRKPLASAARTRTDGVLTDNGDSRSPKATSASKAAMHPEVDAARTPQAAARRPLSAGKTKQDQIARSGVTRKRSHLSSVNKRRQGKRDSR